MNVCAVIAILLLSVSCSKSIGKISGNMPIDDRSAIQTAALESFSCSTGSVSQGNVNCSIQFPSNTDGYKKINIMRIQGQFLTQNCDEGTLVKTLTSFHDQSFIDHTPGLYGESFSFRACLIAEDGHSKSFLSAANVNALDLQAPANLDEWSCTQGSGQGEIDCTIDFPDMLEDYEQFSIRQIVGENAPNQDCLSDGVEVFFEDSLFEDQIVTLSTGSTYGEVYSYRFCIVDSSGNSNNHISISNINSQDLITPPVLDSLTCLANASLSNSIICNIDYPANTSDYAYISLRRIRGIVAPNADCSTDAQVVFSRNSNFIDEAYIDDTSEINEDTFSYRLCIYDRLNNLSSNSVNSVSERANILDSFSCATGTIGMGDIDCTIDYPSQTNSLSKVEIRRLSGPLAPNSNCIEGDLIRSFSPTFSDLSFTDSTGEVSGSSFSYRVCIFSNNGRLIDTSEVSENILTF